MIKRASWVCAAAAAVCAALPATLAAAGELNSAANATAMPTSPVAEAAADATTGPNAGGDIRDIRGPRALFPWVLVLELAAAGVVLAAAAAYFWHRRRHRQARALEYYEIALQRLEELRALMRPATAREFSAAISDIVRRYIEAAFQVTATHQTTEEFLHGILRTDDTPLALHRAVLAEFLRQCDLAKFAGVSLTVEAMEDLYQSARTFIVATSPRPASKAKEARDPLPAT